MGRTTIAVVVATGFLVLALSACGEPSVGTGSDPAGGTVTSSGPGPDDATKGPDHPQTGAASITGRVVDAARQPVIGAMVSARSTASPPVPVPEVAVLTDASGAYAWFGLSPGPYAVEVTTAAGRAQQQVLVSGSGPVSVNLVLRP